MALEIGCPTCGRTLRIADEHRGKQIRCPACQQISIAPEIAGNRPEAQSALAAGGDQSATTWHLRTPDGPTYGPIPWNEVLAWAGEGRVTADCELAESSAGPWRKASELIVHLPASSPPAAPAAAAGYTSATPAAAPSADAVTGYVAPHRGGLVLVLGLLGLFSCPVFSVIAWMMGSHDLREMRSGRMDRRGESVTMAGMILGMILSLIWIVSVVAMMAVLIIAIASRL